MTERNTCALQLCPECGTEQSLSAPLEVGLVSSFPLFHLNNFSEAFAATGWRVGWLFGPASIIQPTLAATTRIVFCTNSPLQEAAATGLEQARERHFFETQVAEYAERRAILVKAFDELGLKYALPEGTYFILLVSLSALFDCNRDSPTQRIYRKLSIPRITHFRPACKVEVGISSENKNKRYLHPLNVRTGSAGLWPWKSGSLLSQLAR
jgi:histidinol-phosphate/aromatic aminotransferase/cobyric acid decarboxylase-like protein